MTERENPGLTILPVMVGTAGHVDHGKTLLVKHLTGCDTDFLPEEKVRGMSIDLGFAPFLLEGSRMVGIIDVPGHEDFLRNMIAGATSIDVLILVIAADDGIMPQTVEHLKIACLLRTPQIMAVITKIDLVSAERRAQVTEDVAAFLSKFGFPDAQIIPESNMTGEGIDEARKAICRLIEHISRPPCERAFRMNIERTFSIKGYGTVITGIPLSGRCAVQDELELFPGRQSVVCRAIQMYNFVSNHAEAHACAALNIRSVKLPKIVRGMTVAQPGVYRETTSAILSLRNVHETLHIKRRQEMRFCCGTSNGVASCSLAGSGNSLAPEEEGFAQIKLSNAIVMAAGDRFIMRSLSPAATVAGGIVLSVNVESRRKKIRGECDQLEMARRAAESSDPFLSEIISSGAAVLRRNTLLQLVQNGDQQVIKKATEDKTVLGTIIPIGPNHWIIRSRIAELEQMLRAALTEYHIKNKFSRGMPADQACAVLGLEANCQDGLKRIFSESQTITVHENCFALTGFSIGLSVKQQAWRGQILKITAEAGKNAIVANVLQTELGANSADMNLLMRILSDEGLITVIDRYIVHTAVVDECLQKIIELFEKNPTVELHQFRAVTGLARNLAVPMLEYFDLKGITGRHGSGRRLMRKTR